jgi:hypothetical protein
MTGGGVGVDTEAETTTNPPQTEQLSSEALAEYLKAQVSQTFQAAEKYWLVVKDRALFKNEAKFQFNGKTRVDRDLLLHQLDLELTNLAKAENLKPEQKTQLENLKRAKIQLVVEQSYADLAFLLTEQNKLAELATKMTEKAKTEQLSKPELEALLVEAKAQQQLIVTFGLYAKSSESLIRAYEQAYPAYIDDFLKTLTKETETAFKLQSATGLEKDSALYQLWTKIIDSSNFHAEIELLETVLAAQPEEKTPPAAVETKSEQPTRFQLLFGKIRLFIKGQYQPPRRQFMPA